MSPDVIELTYELEDWETLLRPDNVEGVEDDEPLGSIELVAESDTVDDGTAAETVDKLVLAGTLFAGVVGLVVTWAKATLATEARKK